MPKKISYVVLACKMLNMDPQSLLSFHEYNDRLAIVTAEGKKFTFNFKQLDDYHQYLLDNQPVWQAERPRRRELPAKRTQRAGRRPVLSGISKPTSGLASSKSAIKEVDLSRKTKKSRTAKAPDNISDGKSGQTHT